MRVRSADTERGHRRAARSTSVRPGPGLGQQGQSARLPVHMTAGPVDVQRRGQHPVPHGLDHLDDACDAGGGLGVADVGLDGAEPERVFGGVGLAVGGEQGLCLDGVAECRAGAVRFDGVDLVGGQLRVEQCLFDDALLGGAVGCGQAVGRAILVDSRGPKEGEDAMSVALRVGKAFEEDEAGSFAPAGAVGGVGEGLAAPVGGQSPLAGELEEGGRRGHHGDTTRERQIAFALTQGLGGQMHAHQGRGTGRVHRHGGALEPERVRHTTGSDARCAAVAEVPLETLGCAVHQTRPVVGVDDSGEDAGVGAVEGGGVDAGVFEGFPGGFEEESLLGVGGEGFAGVHVEEVGVELVGVVEEGAVAGVGLAGGVGVGVVEVVQVPTAIGREAGDGVPALSHQLPQVFGRADSAGVTAGHGDDGDGVVSGGGVVVGGCGGGSGCGVEELVEEVGGEGVGGGVVEDQGGGEAEGGGVGEAVAEFYGGEGVEAEFFEGALGVDGVRGVVAEDGGDVGADEIEQTALLIGFGQRSEFLCQGPGGCRAGGCGASACGGEVA